MRQRCVLRVVQVHLKQLVQAHEHHGGQNGGEYAIQLLVCVSRGGQASFVWLGVGAW